MLTFITEKMLMERKESNQTNKQKRPHDPTTCYNKHMFHIKATQIMVCQFLPSMNIFYVKCFGYLAVVKPF